MPSMFTAFDVTVGNCFLLELERANSLEEPFRMLVDTGNNKKQAPKFLKKHFGLSRRNASGIRRPSLDVVTLTHTDADHLNGLQAVLDLPLTVRELWLPYVMGERSYMEFKAPQKTASQNADLINALPDEAVVNAVYRLTEQNELDNEEFGEHVEPLLAMGRALVRELAQELQAAEVPMSPETWESIDAEVLADQLREAEVTDRAWARYVDRETVRRAGDGKSSWWPWVLNPPFPSVLNWRAVAESSNYSSRFALEFGRLAMLAALCEKGEAVKNAAIRAYKNQQNLYIRWFKYEDKVIQPGTPHNSSFPIGVINADVMYTINPGVNPKDVLAFIAPDPSETNRTSLVLYAPQTTQYPAVLLSADSDFTFTNTGPALTLTPGMLITAPHHGSSSNGGLSDLYKQAWQQNHNLTSTWVRSDKEQIGSSAKRPAQWYKDLDHRVGVERYCTCCAGMKKDKIKPNHVVLQAGPQKWNKLHNNNLCSC